MSAGVGSQLSSDRTIPVPGPTIGAEHFERIYASAFMFDAHEDAIGIALGVNYTSKTQYLFRINKWTLEEWDEVAINKVLAKDVRVGDMPLQRETLSLADGIKRIAFVLAQNLA